MPILFCDILNNWVDLFQIGVNFFFASIGWPPPDYSEYGSIFGCNIV